MFIKTLTQVQLAGMIQVRVFVSLPFDNEINMLLRWYRYSIPHAVEKTSATHIRQTRMPLTALVYVSGAHGVPSSFEIVPPWLMAFVFQIHPPSGFYPLYQDTQTTNDPYI